MPTFRFFTAMALLLGGGVSIFRGQDSRPQVISSKGGGVSWKNLAELKAAADAGDQMACAQLGEQMLRGNRVAQDGPRALELLEKAARAGIPSAMFRIGMLLDDGDGVAQDRVRALDYFRAAAAADVAEAYHNVGAAYAGAHGVKRDYVEALGWLIIAKQHGVGMDSERAVRERISKLNHPEWIAAGEKRALEIEKELGSKPPIGFLPAPAPLVYLGNSNASAASNSSRPSTETTGEVVTLGAVRVSNSAPSSEPEAPKASGTADLKVASGSGRLQRWENLAELQRQADQGEPAALAALGQLLVAGKEVPMDIDRALVVLERGAKAGSIDAAQQLAELYTNGGKVPPDAKKAFQYNLQAARGGSPQAMFKTGAFLSNGMGTARDFTESLAWLIVAKEAGRDLGAEKHIRDYLTKTAPDQIAVAEKRARQLQQEIEAARATQH